VRSLARRRSPDTNGLSYARYRKMLAELEALEGKAQEVHYRVQARRKLIGW
jgi:hypothetical protein